MILSRGQAMMIRKPVELPPAVARAFVKDMLAFVANASGVWDRLLPL